MCACVRASVCFLKNAWSKEKTMLALSLRYTMYLIRCSRIKQEYILRNTQKLLSLFSLVVSKYKKKTGERRMFYYGVLRCSFPISELCSTVDSLACRAVRSTSSTMITKAYLFVMFLAFV